MLLQELEASLTGDKFKTVADLVKEWGMPTPEVLIELKRVASARTVLSQAFKQDGVLTMGFRMEKP